MKISIYIVGTNNYFPLALRFIKKFHKFYKGAYEIEYLLFADQYAPAFLPPDIKVKLINVEHSNWVQGTNSKFKNIIDNIHNIDSNFIFYFDADTNIIKNFNEQWFIGSLVGGQHYNHVGDKFPPFERRKESKAYIPLDTDRPQIYHYGAFFGGLKNKVLKMCEELYALQQEDSKIGLEPIWNDESYLNHFFHYNDHKIVPSHEFQFMISDKGGLETRDTKIERKTLDMLKIYKNEDWEIANGKVLCLTR